MRRSGVNVRASRAVVSTALARSAGRQGHHVRGAYVRDRAWLPSSAAGGFSSPVAPIPKDGRRVVTQEMAVNNS